MLDDFNSVVGACWIETTAHAPSVQQGGESDLVSPNEEDHNYT